jgi:carnitine O-acetyltransferase
MDIIVRKPTEMNAPSTNAIVEAPKHLAFVTDAATEEHIKAASVTIEALSKNSDCGIVYFDEYGSDYVKKVGKAEPWQISCFTSIDYDVRERLTQTQRLL